MRRLILSRVGVSRCGEGGGKCGWCLFRFSIYGIFSTGLLYSDLGEMKNDELLKGDQTKTHVHTSRATGFPYSNCGVFGAISYAIA